MLDLSQIAKLFENGLTAALSEEYIKFRVWTNAGQLTLPKRTGNTVTWYIDCWLHPTGTEKLGTIIDGGGMALTLDLLVPLDFIRTSGETAEQLSRCKEEQYAFLEKVVKAVNSYFSLSETMKVPQFPDAGEKQYSVGLRAGISIPGTVDNYLSRGLSVPFSVFIELNYLEGGINSRGVSVAIDASGNTVPALSSEISRSCVLSSDTYAGTYKRQSVASASGITISLNLPMTESAEQFYDTIILGEINIAHFVFYTVNGKQTVFWMTVDEPAQTAREVSNVGLSLNLIEIVDDEEIFNVPASYQVAVMHFPSSEPRTITVYCNQGDTPLVWAHVGDKLVSIVRQYGTLFPTSIDLDGNAYRYDDETGQYVVYFITNDSADIMVKIGDAEVQFIHIKEATNG